MDGSIEEKSWRFAEEAAEVSLEHYAELLAYMLHDRDVVLLDALLIHGISEALWHRADAHWSAELCATPSWYRVRLAMEFGAAFMRTRIALRNLDGLELKTLSSEAGVSPATAENSATAEDEDDRPTLPELPISGDHLAVQRRSGESVQQKRCNEPQNADE